MRCRRIFLIPLGLTLVSASVAPRHGDDEHPKAVSMTPHNSPDSHSSLHHAAPLLEINETQILESHAPDPISYWIHDWELPSEEAKEKYRGLMVLHVVGMTVSFFGLLPVGEHRDAHITDENLFSETVFF